MSLSQIDTVHLYFRGVKNSDREVGEASALAARQLVWLESPTTLAAALPTMEALACFELPSLDQEDMQWAHASQLKLVQIMGAGVDHLDLSVLPEAVQVTNARGIHGGEIRDHVLSHLLAFARDLPRQMAQQRERRWEHFTAGSLHGATLGILGLGHIGRDIAAAGRALGMHVIGTRRGTADVPESDETLGSDATDRVVSESDYLVVCLPKTDETIGLLDAEMLSKMRPTAVLVVVSRGGIVDEDVLAAMLRAQRLRGAALDVVANEPLVADSDLWDVPNLLLSPHMGGHCHNYLARGFAVLDANLERLERGLPLLTPVDRALGY